MNPILLNFPHELETERLFIRLPKPGDGKVVHEAIQASINELKPWLPFARHEQSEEDAEANIRKAYAQFLARGDLRLLIFHKASEKFVGSSGLHRINWDIPKFEIGYWADSRYSGHGYITEAVEGISDFAFRELQAKRLEILCDTKNLKSRAIPERLDFKLEGIFRSDRRSVDGKGLRDTCVYARIV